MALAVIACLLPSTIKAQTDIGETAGYVNVFIRLHVPTAGSGRVSATLVSGGLDSYKETVDFKQTLPVISMVDMVMFTAKSRPTAGYTFVGWYVDNGDGQFDLSTDEFESSQTEAMLSVPLSLLGLGDADVYATEAEAKAGTKPTEPQLVIYGHFTNGATAEADYKMGMGPYDFKMGTVEMSKPVNSPGDELTIKAIPNEGFRFEYWKTGYGSQWGEDNPNTVVSYDQEYTFTVQGGEHYYAYFSAVNAPEIDLPEEGGWYVGAFNGCWMLHELSQARVFVPSFRDTYSVENQILNDLVVDDQQRAWLDQGDTYAWFDNTLNNRNPNEANTTATLIYGKGKVRFTHNSSSWLSYDRDGNILRWSGSKGTTISDANHINNYHVYAFRPELEAFIKIGTTDEWADVYTSSVTVPANTCFICVDALSIADPDTDYIPEVIGLSPESFDAAVTGISQQQVKSISISGYRFYTLDGKQAKTGHRKGMYVKNGKKVIIQ